jgi:hypothetical protein
MEREREREREEREKWKSNERLYILKHEIRLNNIYRFSSYGTENTQLVN